MNSNDNKKEMNILSKHLTMKGWTCEVFKRRPNSRTYSLSIVKHKKFNQGRNRHFSIIGETFYIHPEASFYAEMLLSDLSSFTGFPAEDNIGLLTAIEQLAADKEDRENWNRERKLEFDKQIEKDKEALIELAKSGAPRPSLYGETKEERRLAVTLNYLTKTQNPNDLNRQHH